MHIIGAGVDEEGGFGCVDVFLGGVVKYFRNSLIRVEARKSTPRDQQVFRVRKGAHDRHADDVFKHEVEHVSC